MDEEKILEYTTKEQMERVREMDEKEIFASIMPTYDTDSWIAMLKFIIKRTNMCQSMINNTDPITNASKILRYQGMIDGLWDLVKFYKEEEIEFESKKE